jgi:hypothetical protein
MRHAHRAAYRASGSLQALTMALAVGVSLVGCSVAGPTAAAQITCVDQAFRAGLHVDARDPRRVWATNDDAGRDVAVLPRPPGQFVFDASRPNVLLDAFGKIVSFDGEITITGCFDAQSRTLYMGEADVSNPKQPPN